MKKIYNTVTEADVTALRGIIGSAERVIAWDAIGEDYSHDEFSGVRRNPEVLIKVANAEEVAGVRKYANSRRIPVTPHCMVYSMRHRAYSCVRASPWGGRCCTQVVVPFCRTRTSSRYL